MPKHVGGEIAGYYTLGYDAWNRLIDIESDDATPLTLATYTYDGLGRRIKNEVDNSDGGDLDCT